MADRQLWVNTLSCSPGCYRVKPKQVLPGVVYIRNTVSPDNTMTMQVQWKKNVMPHIWALLCFVVLAFAYCSPVLQGDRLQQYDMTQVEGMSHEAKMYYDQTGQHPLWSNAMFGGMPTYMTYTGPSANVIAKLNQVFTLDLPSPVNMLFLAMLGMYFLLSVLGMRYWIRLLGAVAYGFSSFNVIIIGAGHITQMMCMAYMAPVLAGILLVYRGRYLAGGLVTALSASLLIYNNHLQIIYYTIIVALFAALGHLVLAWKNKTMPDFIKGSAVCLIAGILAALPAAGNLLITHEYTPYSIRGSQSELTLAHQATDSHASKGGLDIDYAYQWSLGKLETFSVFVPNIYGGPPPSSSWIQDSHTYHAITDLGANGQQAAGFAQQALYWGPQPFTTPVYFGAVVIVLFFLSFFSVRSPHKWWLLALTLAAVVMAWGKNFPALNDLLFYHLPLYNKFRNPSMIMVIPQLIVVLLACWALEDFMSGTLTKDQALKALKQTAYVAFGVLVLLYIIPGALLNYQGPNDAQLSSQPTLLRAVLADRASLLHSDVIRSMILVALVLGALYLWILKKIKLPVLAGILGLLLLFDLFKVDKRYLNTDNFSDSGELASSIQPNAAEQAIMKDTDPYYRVLNLAAGAQNVGNIFNGDALTSYFVKSVGGYSPAKLWRYQDLIDYQLYPEITSILQSLQGKKTLDSASLDAFMNQPVLNLLNTRYFILNPDGPPLRNDHALGNAWFVQHIQWAANADSEMVDLGHIQPGSTAVIDQRQKDLLSGYHPTALDSGARVTLTQYGLNELQFHSSNPASGLAVFSDIYYPAGWKAYIDGQEAPILRVDYAFRGLLIPGGTHQIVFRFHPNTYYLGERISGISSWLLLIVVIGALIASGWRALRETSDSTPDAGPKTPRTS